MWHRLQHLRKLRRGLRGSGCRLASNRANLMLDEPQFKTRMQVFRAVFMGALREGGPCQ